MNAVGSDYLKIGICCAIVAHCYGLMFLSTPKRSADAPATSVVIKLESSAAEVAEKDEMLGMESLSPHALNEKKIADKKREIYLNYLEDVGACIHSQRFLHPKAASLIGIASYQIRIEADGSFSYYRLLNSSGNQILDEAGLMAIKACSGKVKRPPSVGVNPIVISREVRYQYQLH